MEKEDGELRHGRLVPLACGTAFLAATAAALLLLNSKEPPMARGLWLAQRGTGDIRGIAVNDRSGELEMSLSLEMGEWRLDSGETVARERVASLLAVLGYMKASHDAGKEGGLAQYGLAAPKKTFRVEYSDGQSDVWRLGDFREDNAYLGAADGKVYLIDGLRAGVMDTAAEKLLEVPLDQVDFGRINGIRIQSPSKGEIRLSRSESPRAGGDFFWRIFEPYSGNARKDAADEIVALAAGAGWLRRAGGTNCGFDGGSPKTLTFYDAFDRQLVMRIGGMENGRAFCKIDGLPGVYTIAGDIASVFDISPESLVDTTLYHYEPSSVMEFQFVWEEREHYFVSVWEEAGDDKRGQRFVMDSGGISGADYHEFVKMLCGISAEGLYSEGEG
jgi:hypothetical protein